MRKQDNKKIEKVGARIMLAGVFFSLLYGLIAVRVIYLQVYNGKALEQMASREYQRTGIVKNERGTIYDRHRNEMAISIEATSIGAHPGRIAHPAEAAKRLAAVLNLSPERLRSRLGSSQAFVWLKRHVTPDEEEKVRQLSFPAGQLAFIPESKRVYPNATLAAQVFGFVGIDGNGLEGLEYACDNFLKGSTRQYTLFKDALGRKFEAESDRPDLSGRGNDVILTLDSTLQCITEEALQAAMTRSKALSGMAVVMDPASGEVLAMANAPFFNPNAFAQYSQKRWRNRVVSDPFEPGSTMKIFLAAAAIESGICTPRSVFFCEKGVYQMYDDYRIHDHKSYEWLSLRQIIKYSSNIGAVKVSQSIGPEVLWQTLRRFGFGAETGLRCPGETQGILSHYRQWKAVDTGSIAFGQGISVSAIQLISAVSAIANDGLWVQPRIINAIVSPQGEMVQNFYHSPTRRVISPQSAEVITRMMADVTMTGGTGERAALAGYTVCGKTGTAQKLNADHQYTDEEVIASFVGFVPEKEPRLAVLVVIDSPMAEHYGGTVAAPAFRQIARKGLNYLGVPPTQSQSDDLMVLLKKEGNG